MTDSEPDIHDLDHGPFAMVPDEAFIDAEKVCDGIRRVFIVGIIGIIVSCLYVFILPLTVYWLYRYVRLKYKHPILFEWRQFFSGLSIKELKQQAKDEDDHQLRQLLRLRIALFQMIFLMIWPAIFIGLSFLPSLFMWASL